MRNRRGHPHQLPGVTDWGADVVIGPQRSGHREPPALHGFGASSIPTEAALLVNDCTTNSGTSPNGASCSPSGTFQGGNPTQGFLQNGVLIFSGFTLPTGGNPFLLRITNIRVNTNQLTAGALVSGSVMASFPISNSQNLVLGGVEPSLSLSVSTPLPSFTQCQPQTTTITNFTIGRLLYSAFKSLASATNNATPGGWFQNSNTESQTVLQPLPAGWIDQLSGIVPGQADTATRIRVNIANIPLGVTVTLPVNVNNGSGGTLTASSGGDLGTFSAAPGVGIAITSSGSVTYEVRAISATLAFNIPITISGSGNVGAGSILVSATYAPTGLESSTAIPRFADSSAPTPLFSVLTRATPMQLAFTTQPVNGTPGSALPAIVVQLQDASGNISAASNAPVTLTSSSSSISTTVNAVNGVATFSGLLIGTPGTYALTATSPGLASATSRPFTINNPPASVCIVVKSFEVRTNCDVDRSGFAVDGYRPHHFFMTGQPC